VTDNQ